ncbi:MAG: efflux RND transporter periplasmic adaptor subunit, partial [Ignavibacteriales bacterium]|nr:efflux RND transporter periplasmic adaptor subunit [Ignavibacteriales bacterium]
MSEKRFDLSKLKIRREQPTGIGPQHPPSRPHIAYLMYIGGAIFLGLGVYFFLANILREDPIVEITTVSFISPAQADAILTASGYVVAQRKAAIASKATGRLVYLGYKEGDRVKKDEIIARIESADVEAALAQAKADYEVAKADKADTEKSFERAKKLFASHLISQAEYDAAEARYERVSASIASREAAVKAAEVQFENTRIRAPFDGTILSKNADIGEVVTPFAAGASSRVAVVTIADMKSLEV